ncbi:IS3 family transposase [Selenomonas sp. ND2010]|uniref:IS3 family transposase n=1 Tax=Selenomonas sp. ND2010 TaxID=1410618 RepID=UPI0012DEC18D
MKHEYFYLRKFKTVEKLKYGVYQFIYGKYNRKRTYSYNGGLTPYVTQGEV